MKVWNKLSEFPKSGQAGVLSIGNFDGVHLGHQSLLLRNLEVARARNLSSSLLSFSPHPVKVLHPERGLRELFPLADMVERVEALGLDHLVVEPFTLELSQKSPEEFVELFVKSMAPSHLVLGDDFRFGSQRAGGFTEIEKLGKLHGFTVEQINPVDLGGVRMSSTIIRECLSSGDVRVAANYLGRSFELRGHVVGGEQRGRRLGFPTANIDVENEIIPKVGVYVTELEVNSKIYPSLTNIGYRPTFEGETDTHRLSVETYVIRGQLELYGENVKLGFLQRVRPELKFSSPDELIKQIEQDVQFAEEYFAR